MICVTHYNNTIIVDVCALLFLGQMTRLLLKAAKAVRNKEPVDLALMLRNVMSHYLPNDVHKRLRKRLHISMTKLNGLGNVLVTDFRSKEHLIEVSFNLQLSY